MILVNAFGLRSLRSRFSTESTTIGLLAKISGLMEPLKEFVKTKSVWGTCAGAILLSQAVSNPKKGGQELLGGVSVKMTRNGWGSQVRCLDLSVVINTGLASHRLSLSKPRCK
jgi:5'-phosphate synthase pdxT subunit